MNKKPQRIGIMTMHRIVNYGSFLQAYALYNVIADLGFDVEMVDYHVCSPLFSKSFDFLKYIGSIIITKGFDILANNRWLFSRLPLPHKYEEKCYASWRYRTEFLPLIGVTDKWNYTPNVDILIIGSDEVFNCLQTNVRVGFSKELFGQRNNSKKLISYAASFGNTTLSGINESNISNILKKLLVHFAHISVRDQNSYDIISKIVGINPSKNIDPVLLYDFSTLIPNLSIKTGFILVYAYRNRLNEDETSAIKKFAKMEEKRIVSIGGYQPFSDENVNCSPFEVLSYFQFADYVITDTYHGTIFSLISHKKFITFVRKSQDGQYGNSEKLLDLLSLFSLCEREINDINSLSEVIKSEIDYSQVEIILSEQRNKSINYLRSALKN